VFPPFPDAWNGFNKNLSPKMLLIGAGELIRFDGKYKFKSCFIGHELKTSQFISQEEFRFRPEILAEAEETIERVGGRGRVRIGIHVRRTDYKQQLFKAYKIKAPAAKDYYKVIKIFIYSLFGMAYFAFLFFYRCIFIIFAL